MTDSHVEPVFLDTGAGRIFVIFRNPPNAKGCVLFVAPFAEEMNKTRRQITETSVSLGEMGYATIAVDLYGTGDSEGDFEEATWNIWKSNIEAAIAWTATRNCAVDALVATRLGCALAAESIRETGRSVNRSVFWQPVESGKQHIRQFLRLRVAASLMEADKLETVDGLKNRLDSGEALEIAGYSMSSTLCSAIEGVELARLLDPCLGSICIFEIGRSIGDGLSVAGRRLVTASEERGIPVSGMRLRGEPFWMATEIVTNQELNELTVKYLTEVKRS